jgi:ABC-type uncharacterized transport system substrate-binding protein
MFAHPHTFIEVYPTINIKNKTVENIHFTWKFDEMTSSMLIMEFDENGNNILDQKEQKYIYENYFISLVNFNFYSDITINQKIIKFPDPKYFQASIKENKLLYSFEIDKKFNINDSLIDFGDTDFFIAMILKKEFVTVNGAKAIVSDLDNDFYFGYRLELK